MRSGTTRNPPNWRRLRFRVAISFALGGLIVTVALAFLTYGLIDRYLYRQRERTALRQAFVNARVLRDELQVGQGSDVTTALQNLELPTGSSVILRRDGVWYGTSVVIGRSTVPRELRSVVVAAQAGRQRIEIAGTTSLAVGLPIRSIDAEYFEVAIFDELENSLGVVRNSLLGAAAITTLGAALLGLSSSRRVLRPLREISVAAGDIAAGKLDRRLDRQDDPDLDPLTNSFNQMVDALQRRIERDARFASDVSHELRSPLTTITTATSVIEQRRDELTPRLQEPFDLLREEVDRFERLVVELLELTRAESGEEVEREAVLVGDVADYALRSGGHDCVLDIDSELGRTPIVTDKRRLERVLANLLDNARNYGGGATRLVIRTDGPLVRLTVEDRGPGVPKEERTKIFDRFFRGAVSGRRGHGSGTGLGLALVVEHVRLLDGRVWVEPGIDGTGAHFVVEIPNVSA